MMNNKDLLKSIRVFVKEAQAWQNPYANQTFPGAEGTPSTQPPRPHHKKHHQHPYQQNVQRPMAPTLPSPQPIVPQTPIKPAAPAPSAATPTNINVIFQRGQALAQQATSGNLNVAQIWESIKALEQAMPSLRINQDQTIYDQATKLHQTLWSLVEGKKASLSLEIEAFVKEAQQNEFTANKILEDSWNSIASALAFKITKPVATAKAIQEHLNVINQILTNLHKTAQTADDEDEYIGDSYFESAKGQIISHSRALKEIKDHDGDITEFYRDLGHKDKYKATDVLKWLGY